MTKKYPPPHRALYSKYQLKEAEGWGGRRGWISTRMYSYGYVRMKLASSSRVHKKFYRTSSMRLNLATYIMEGKQKLKTAIQTLKSESL